MPLTPYPSASLSAASALRLASYASPLSAYNNTDIQRLHESRVRRTVRCPLARGLTGGAPWAGAQSTNSLDDFAAAACDNAAEDAMDESLDEPPSATLAGLGLFSHGRGGATATPPPPPPPPPPPAAAGGRPLLFTHPDSDSAEDDSAEDSEGADEEDGAAGGGDSAGGNAAARRPNSLSLSQSRLGLSLDLSMREEDEEEEDDDMV